MNTGPTPEKGGPLGGLISMGLDIPVEVWLRIFSFLEPIHLNALTQVCHTFTDYLNADLFKNLWKFYLQKLCALDPSIVINPDVSYRQQTKEAFKKIYLQQLFEINSYQHAIQLDDTTPLLLRAILTIDLTAKSSVLMADLAARHQLLNEVNAQIIISKMEVEPQTLNLSHSHLTRIPQPLIDNVAYRIYWTTLWHLSCSNNQLRHLPKLSLLSSLRSLDCSHNQLSMLPSLDQNTRLRELICHHNCLKSLPSLDPLPLLESLTCGHNELAELPPLNLALLETLDCQFNQLSTLPDLTSCSRLELLNCLNNRLFSLPTLNRCVWLRWVYCGHNQLSTAPDFSFCSLIEYIDCTHNQLRTIPKLPDYSRIRYLYCENNQIRTIPESLEFNLGTDWAKETLARQKTPDKFEQSTAYLPLHDSQSPAPQSPLKRSHSGNHSAHKNKLAKN